MNVLRTARAITTALFAFPSLVLFAFADDIDEVWEPFLDDTYG